MSIAQELIHDVQNYSNYSDLLKECKTGVYGCDVKIKADVMKPEKP